MGLREFHPILRLDLRDIDIVPISKVNLIDMCPSFVLVES